jgi:hypothetical protein
MVAFFLIEPPAGLKVRPEIRETAPLFYYEELVAIPILQLHHFCWPASVVYGYSRTPVGREPDSLKYLLFLKIKRGTSLVQASIKCVRA